MGPNDIVDVMFFNDKGVVEDSKWVNTKAAATASINNVPRTYPAQGRTRPLFNILKQAATDGFKELGNAGQSVVVPMHQAMVVLSNGSAGADTTTNAGTSLALKDYLTKGRFPENNDVLPKTPVPVISVWFPNKVIEEFGANAREFMEGMANTEIGGFFTIMRDGQAGRAANIVNSVRTRFNKMHIVKWRVACVAPSITQTFKLFFSNTNPVIAGDATFQNVPVGIDPTTWPIDIDREATERAAKSDPIYAGGTVRVYGNFCWGGSAQRAEIYMVPKNQAAPASLQNGNIEDAKKAQRTLIEAGMRGKAITAGDSVVEFELPKTDKFLVGKGETMTARLIVYDNQARRTSAVTADKIISSGRVTRRCRTCSSAGPPSAASSSSSSSSRSSEAAAATNAAAPRRRLPVRSSPAARPPCRWAAARTSRTAAAAAAALPRRWAAWPPARPFRHGGHLHRDARPRDARRLRRRGLPDPPDGAARVGHAPVVKFESGQLLVRDENSNNGTYINGQRIPGGV